MRRLFLPIFISLFAISLVNCEPDDICDENTPTTPRLILSFYSTEGVLKTFQKLEVREITMDSIITYTSSSEIQIPLRTDADTVTYSLKLTSGSSSDPQIYNDQLQFSYSPENVYVSRACGFKTIFTFDDQNPLVINNDPTAVAGNWINSYSIETYTIDSEKETHIKIIF